MPIYEQSPHTLGFNTGKDGTSEWVRFDLYLDGSIQVDKCGTCPLLIDDILVLQEWLEAVKTDMFLIKNHD